MMGRLYSRKMGIHFCYDIVILHFFFFFRLSWRWWSGVGTHATKKDIVNICNPLWASKLCKLKLWKMQNRVRSPDQRTDPCEEKPSPLIIWGSVKKSMYKYRAMESQFYYWLAINKKQILIKLCGYGGGEEML